MNILAVNRGWDRLGEASAGKDYYCYLECSSHSKKLPMWAERHLMYAKVHIWGVQYLHIDVLVSPTACSMRYRTHLVGLGSSATELRVGQSRHP